MMRWTIGNYYKTRDGSKVALLWITDSEKLLFLRCDTESVFRTDTKGLYDSPGRRHHALDIISKWSDPARAMVEVYLDKGNTIQLFPAGILSDGVRREMGLQLIARREIVEGEGME
jgi:hypothetical protein